MHDALVRLSPLIAASYSTDNEIVPMYLALGSANTTTIVVCHWSCGAGNIGLVVRLGLLLRSSRNLRLPSDTDVPAFARFRLDIATTRLTTNRSLQPCK